MGIRRRVAITGLGVITPIGNNVTQFWRGLIEGRSGVGPLTRFDPEKYACKIAAEIRGFDPREHFDPKLARNTEAFVQYGLVAAREAWEQSGIAGENLDPYEIGCLLGGGVGGIGYIQEMCGTLAARGPEKVSPFMIPKIIANIAPAYVAMEFNIKGPNYAVISACAAGTNAIGEAAEIIRRGDAKVMIAGGTESAICSIAVSGFDKMKAMCSDSNEEPQKGSRPFDATRSGFVMGEGAGALILEDLDFAKARGATILAELAGYSITSDAYHITAPAPHGEGDARALMLAIERSGLKPEDIGYINAHGTSTPLNDKLETEAIKTVFGEHASKLAVSSNKSMIGHLMGAAGAVEAVATVMSLREQILPPTINYNNPDPECDLDYVANTARKVEGLNAALSNSLGFGGHNSVIVLTRASA